MRGSVLIERPGVGLVVSRASLAARVSARLRFATLDEALAAGADPESRPALTLRAGRLIAPRMRRRLARALRRFVELARRPRERRAPWPAAPPPLPAGGPHVLHAAGEALAPHAPAPA
jgi:hypothetical protein